jgi:hypothetical protein
MIIRLKYEVNFKKLINNSIIMARCINDITNYEIKYNNVQLMTLYEHQISRNIFMYK